MIYVNIFCSELISFKKRGRILNYSTHRSTVDNQCLIKTIDCERGLNSWKFDCISSYCCCLAYRVYKVKVFELCPSLYTGKSTF